jgi:hypothetical protein
LNIDDILSPKIEVKVLAKDNFEEYLRVIQQQELGVSSPCKTENRYVTKTHESMLSINDLDQYDPRSFGN